MSSDPDQFVDGLILSAASRQWRKVALIVATVLTESRNSATERSEHIVAGRIQALVDEGKLEAQGNLSLWRHSEVRLRE